MLDICFKKLFVLLTCCVCFFAENFSPNTGRAEEVYDKAFRDMEQLSDAKFDECLGGLLAFYVQRVTSPEPPGPGTMPMSRQEVVDSARGAPSDARAANDYNVALAVARANRADDAPADAPDPADVGNIAFATADITADATAADDDARAGDSDVSVDKTPSGSESDSGAKTTSATKDNGKCNKKAVVGARGGAAAGRGGTAAAPAVAAAPPKSPPAAAKRGRGGGRG